MFSPIFTVNFSDLGAMTSEASQVSSLPLPPVQYINQFSDENIRRGRAPRPPPPIHDSYSMFGVQYQMDDAIIRPLESQVKLSFVSS